jgi:hypothetical protein
MATIRATLAGDFNTGSNWIGGVAPGINDEAVANGLTMTINGTVTVQTLRNDTLGGATAGGTFVLANGSSLTTTASTGLVTSAGSQIAVLTFNLPSLQSASYNGSVLTMPYGGTITGFGTRLIEYNNTGTFNITGNFNIDFSNINQRKCIILIFGSGRVNINGDLTNSVGSPTNNAHAPLRINSVANIFITSILITGGVAPSGAAPAIWSEAAANINITCTTILGGISPAIYMIGGGTCIITAATTTGGGGTIPAIQNITLPATVQISGAVIAGTNSNAVSSLSSVSVVGNVTVPALGTAAAITTTQAVTVTGNVITNGLANGVVSGTLATINGLIFNNQQWQGVFAPRILIGALTTAMRYQTFAGATQLMFSGSSITLGQPTPNNVRLGTSYGLAPNNFVGTCVIPNPNTVVLGAPTDNTVGTLVMSPAAVIQELNTSTLDVAVRLRNVSTVQTMGEQAATYGI